MRLVVIQQRRSSRTIEILIVQIFMDVSIYHRLPSFLALASIFDLQHKGHPLVAHGMAIECNPENVHSNLKDENSTTRGC